jgi:hypothetical protein
MKHSFWIFGLFLFALVACNQATPQATLPATLAPTTIVEQFQEVPPTDTPAALPTPSGPPEIIQILEPGPGSRVVSPVRITGMADSTFEQNLVARIVLDDGSELALAPTTIQSELGTRGAFEFDLPFVLEGDRQGFIQVFSTSPRDGGTIHLNSVGVLLAASGEAEIRALEPYAERIQIELPAIGAEISGGKVTVSGIALASFEQTLVVDVLDQDGNVIGSRPLIVDSPEWGIPGPFSIEVTYLLEVEGAGRVVVRDPSVAFNGDVHLASVEVRLKP